MVGSFKFTSISDIYAQCDTIPVLSCHFSKKDPVLLCMQLWHEMLYPNGNICGFQDTLQMF